MSNNHKENREKGRLSSLVSEKFRLPSDALAGEFRAELRGRGLLYLFGCKRILKYSSEEMIVAARSFEVTVRGEGLVCSFFYGGAMAIEGEIGGFYLPEKGE